LHFSLPGTGHEIDVKGIVVWSQPNGIAGIRFTEISTSTSDHLRNWIASARQTLPESMETDRQLNELPLPADRPPVQAF
jgi:predicted Zn-dependent protease